MIDAHAPSLTFVIHEASLTGAPRLGLSIAQALARHVGVDLVFRTGGALLSDLDHAPFRSVSVIHDQPGDESARIHESRTAASTLLERQKPKYLYVNSLSGSEWLLARPSSVEKAALHTHEASHEMDSLIVGKLFWPTSVQRADILIGASQETIGLLRGLNPDGFVAEIDFGVAIDWRRIEALSREEPLAARNAGGAPLLGLRPLVVMCGMASRRKGADLFADLAAALPDADFLWVGPWTAEEGAKHRDWLGTPHEALKRDLDAPVNLYFTGPVANPYPWMRAADLFFLSSREDPNPIVAIEALALGRLVVAFRRSGQAGARCMTHGVAISGAPDAKHARLVIATLLERTPALSPPQMDRAAFDIEAKLAEVVRAFGL